ncbi:hypothetical protein SVAN01_01797 [Stagonosporopsis vannaccii]|nr:hypothetical protein SVAN01_01797 [Stagonosporopsis vannaccii]
MPSADVSTAVHRLSYPWYFHTVLRQPWSSDARCSGTAR